MNIGEERMLIMLTLAAAGGRGLDPAVVAAIIAGIAAVVGAIIAFAGIMYGSRQQKKILRFQKELDAQEAAKQQEKQRKADTLEAVRREMLLAQNNTERARAYRRALHADPRISRLQILDMSRPLEVTSVYVRVRVHEEARLRYEVDPQLSRSEQERDPNAMLQASRAYMERRASTAIDPDEALRKYRRCAILGDPGAGKTTLLKYLTLKAADKQLADLPDLPIHIELNAFAVSTEYQDLLDFAAHTWDERYAFLKADARAYMDKMLRDGKALLLLDALDETAIGEQTEVADASYQRVCDTIMRATTRYPDAPIVVTARKAGYQRHMSLTGFTELEVLDFRPEDIEQFVSKWFTCTGDAQGESKAAELNARLRRSPRIQALAANPLLLSLIALVYEAQLDLPDRRADLYRRCVDVLLNEWDARRNIRRRREFKPEHKRQLLQELAWHFHRQGLRYFPEREVQAEIARFLPALGLPAEDYERVLIEIANENGLLKEQAHGWYGFLHLTLQEYFVALYINEHPHELASMLQQIGDPWWEEPLLLYAGQTGDASPLLQSLTGSSDQAGQASLEDDLFHTNLILAGRCLAARPTVRQVALRGEVIARLVDLLQTTTYALTREQAAQALAEIGGQTVNERLLGLLADARVDKYVRGRIAEALGALGERSVAPQLLGLLANEQINEDVRQSIARALGALGERSVVLQLLGLLANEQVHGYLRGSIARALGALGERSVVLQLLGLLANEQVDTIVRMSIADALGALGERSVVPHMLRMLANEQVNRYLRESIAGALGALGEPSVVPHMLRMLANEQVDQSVRGSIVGALGALGERSVMPQLLGLLANDRIDGYARQIVAETLGALGERSVVPQLVWLLEIEWVPNYVRWSIAGALGALGERSIVPQLVGLLANEQVDKEVRGSIAEALGTLGERSVAPQLVRLLVNEQVDKEVRGSIVDALAGLIDKEVDVRTLATFLHGSNLDITDNIYRALWTASRRVGVRVLVRNEAGKERLEVVRR
jgi:HEAT repeat protein